MFTFFLIIISLLAFFSVVFASRYKPSKEKRENELASMIVTIKYLKRMCDDSPDGLMALQYSNQRESKIEELILYIEKYAITDPDIVRKAEVIRLDSYRPGRQA